MRPIKVEAVQSVWPNQVVPVFLTSDGARVPITSKGHPSHLTYMSWRNMIGRCYKPGFTAYRLYGGNGVSVCERWRGDLGFVNFLEDMGERPSRGMSLNRKGGSKVYSRETTEWATSWTQVRERSVTRWIEFKGRILCARDWGRFYGMGDNYILSRVGRDELCSTLRRLEAMTPGGVDPERWAPIIEESKTLASRGGQVFVCEAEGPTTSKRGRFKPRKTPEPPKNTVTQMTLRTRRVFDSVVTGCTDQASPGWPRLGGTGVSCDGAWIGPDGLKAFLSDLGPSPAEGWGLKLVPGSTCLCKGGCRWAPPREAGIPGFFP